MVYAVEASHLVACVYVISSCSVLCRTYHGIEKGPHMRLRGLLLTQLPSSTSDGCYILRKACVKLSTLTVHPGPVTSYGRKEALPRLYTRMQGK